MDFNYFIFVRFWYAFVGSLYLIFQAWDASWLSFLLYLQVQPHIQRHHMPFSLRSAKPVLNFPLCAFWLIISSYDLTLHILSVPFSLHKHCYFLLYGCWIYGLLFFPLFPFFILLIEKLTFVASIILMQGVPWIIFYVFLKQGFAFVQEHDSLPYQSWQLISSYLP